MELGSYFLFLQEQIKDIIISRSTEHPKTDGDTAVTNVTDTCDSEGEREIY